MRARICNLKLVLFKKCKGVIPRDLKLKLKSILMHKSTLVIKRVPMEIVSPKDYSQIWIKIDELAVVRKMIEFIPGKDRFHKMRRFTNYFLESEVVDFLSEGQYLESPEKRGKEGCEPVTKGRGVTAVSHVLLPPSHASPSRRGIRRAHPHLASSRCVLPWLIIHEAAQGEWSRCRGGGRRVAAKEREGGAYEDGENAMFDLY
ncbi:hypothetical protein HN51_025681 [Arachis hypogaea]